MALRDVGKRALPVAVTPYVRMGYGLFKAVHYYPPYLFMDGRAKTPRQIMFEITFRCNLRCIMCPLAQAFDDPNSQVVREWKEKKELTREEIFKMTSDGAKMGVETLAITGGEPFLRKDLFDIICYAKGKAMRCSILSNGTLISEETAKRIVASGLDVLQFSLDGPRDIHNKIRNKNNAYERTLDAARFVAEEKRRTGSRVPAVSFCCTISAANMSYLVPLVDIAHDVNANLRFGYLFYTTDNMMYETDAMIQMGRAKGEDQDVPRELKQVDPEKLHREVLLAKKRASDLGVYVTFQPDLSKDEIRRRFYDDRHAYVDKCFYPWYAVRVNPYGVVYPCSMNIEMGNLRQDSLEDIWNNDRYVKFRKALKKNKLFPKCVKCCKLDNKLWRYLPSL